MTGIFGPTSPADDFTVDSFGVRGPTGPSPLSPLAPWAAGTPYVAGPPASFVSWQGVCYVCMGPHTSTVFAADLATGLWALAFQVTPAALQAAAAAALLSTPLPTKRPSTSGLLWNNNGTPAIS